MGRSLAVVESSSVEVFPTEKGGGKKTTKDETRKAVDPLRLPLCLSSKRERGRERKVFEKWGVRRKEKKPPFLPVPFVGGSSEEIEQVKE